MCFTESFFHTELETYRCVCVCVYTPSSLYLCELVTVSVLCLGTGGALSAGGRLLLWAVLINPLACITSSSL